MLAFAFRDFRASKVGFASTNAGTIDDGDEDNDNESSIGVDLQPTWLPTREFTFVGMISMQVKKKTTIT